MHDQKPVILLVEDEFLIRDYVADSLEDAGFSVLRASDGVEALKFFEDGKRVDLVFTDITLPGGIDGFGVAKWVRSKYPSLPVVLTSGGHNAEKAAEICKGEPFVSKPYDLGALVGYLGDLLKGATSH